MKKSGAMRIEFDAVVRELINWASRGQPWPLTSPRFHVAGVSALVLRGWIEIAHD